MSDKSIIDKRNYDNSFTRKVILGILTYLYEKIEYKQTIDNKDSKHKIPFYYSYTGDEQFLNDFFRDTDDYYQKICDKGFKTEGNTLPVPAGIVKYKGLSINKTYMTTQYSRMNISTKEETDFGMMTNNSSVRTNMIPLLFQFDVELISSSTTQQFNISEELIKKLVGARKFYIGEYEGYKMLPVFMGFPDDYELETLIKFAPGDSTQRTKMEFTLEVLAYMPRKLENSEYKFNESIKTFKLNEG